MKKKGVTKKKRNRKLERLFFKTTFPPGIRFSEEQLQAARQIALQHALPRLLRCPVGSGKTILYSGKLARIWGTPLSAAKLLAEELRHSPSVGARLLAQEILLRWNVKGFVPKMFKALGKYLEDPQPVFDQVDYKIIHIVEQHPQFTIKQITSALNEQYPRRKWDTLEKRVRRLLKNSPWFPG
jgi:hypothetical protein